MPEPGIRGEGVSVVAEPASITWVDLVSGLGSIALLVTTIVYVVFTYRIASESRDTARATRDGFRSGFVSLIMSSQPVLIVDNLVVRRDAAGRVATLRFRVTNDGPGAAFNVVLGESDPPVLGLGHSVPLSGVLRVGQELDCEVNIPVSERDVLVGKDWQLKVVVEADDALGLPSRLAVRVSTTAGGADTLTTERTFLKDSKIRAEIDRLVMTLGEQS